MEVAGPMGRLHQKLLCNTQGDVAIRQANKNRFASPDTGLEIGEKREGDHKNHDTLDNTDDNLQSCNSPPEHPE